MTPMPVALESGITNPVQVNDMIKEFAAALIIATFIGFVLLFMLALVMS